MASKNEFLSNYREWEFKLLKCDVLNGPFALRLVSSYDVKKAAWNWKRFNIDHLNVFNIYYESERVEGRKKWFNIYFLLFSDARAIEGVENLRKCVKNWTVKGKCVGRVALIFALSPWNSK